MGPSRGLHWGDAAAGASRSLRCAASACSLMHALPKWITSALPNVRADCEAIYDPQQWPEKRVPLPSPLSLQQLAGSKFAAGSMGPKVEAACRFVAATGGRAGVGRIEDAVEIMRGSKGTIITSA